MKDPCGPWKLAKGSASSSLARHRLRPTQGIDEGGLGPGSEMLRARGWPTFLFLDSPADDAEIAAARRPGRAGTAPSFSPWLRPGARRRADPPSAEARAAGQLGLSRNRPPLPHGHAVAGSGRMKAGLGGSWRPGEAETKSALPPAGIGARAFGGYADLRLPGQSASSLPGLEASRKAGR